jgi:TolA-binding protein
VDDQRVLALQRQVNDLKEEIGRLLWPVSILLGILALGGGLGVVFSIRDQRRVSQLHELTVAGEQAAQRRSEDSYSTFIDASQKTLALVNDTLQLAKEATERANQTMSLRAERSLTAIADRAQDLLDKVLLGDFKAIVADARLRADLEGLAKELATIEGYLSLQAIPLRPECLFVQGMSRHLQNDARGAIRAFRQVGEKGVSRDLRALAQYWIAYLHNNRGEYREAAEIFRASQQHLSSDSPRYLELERISWETEFFLAAKQCVISDAATRRAAVLGALTQLERCSTQAARDAARYEKVSQSIAGTRANILTWVANVRVRLTPGIDSSRDAALREAQALYAIAGRGMFSRFGECEARYYLGEHVEASEYSGIERDAMEFLQNRREPRNTANLYETILIARFRQQELNSVQVDALDIYTKVQAAIGDILDADITIFSQFEKRNVTKAEFAAEVAHFYEAIRANQPAPRAHSRAVGGS